MHVVYASVDEISVISKDAYQRRTNSNGDHGNVWWRVVYQNWDEEQFKEKFGIFKCNFDHMVHVIRTFIEKTPTNIVPVPIQPDKRLALTVYRLAHGCSFAVISDLFG